MFVVDKNEKFVVVGIVSFGYGCGSSADTPGVYTKVHSFLDFIKAVISDGECGRDSAAQTTTKATQSPSTTPRTTPATTKASTTTESFDYYNPHDYEEDPCECPFKGKIAFSNLN